MDSPLQAGLRQGPREAAVEPGAVGQLAQGPGGPQVVEEPGVLLAQVVLQALGLHGGRHEKVSVETLGYGRSSVTPLTAHV